MKACCSTASDRKSSITLRRAREIAAWVLPSAMLVLMPKCPICLAAYVALWTGLGVSLATATYLRWSLLSLSVGSLLFLVLNGLRRLEGHVVFTKKETEP